MDAKYVGSREERNKMMKRMFLEVMNLVFNRRQIIRLSRALMNQALGDNNDDMKTNGEFFCCGEF